MAQLGGGRRVKRHKKEFLKIIKVFKMPFKSFQKHFLLGEKRRYPRTQPFSGSSFFTFNSSGEKYFFSKVPQLWSSVRKNETMFFFYCRLPLVTNPYVSHNSSCQSDAIFSGLELNNFKCWRVLKTEKQARSQEIILRF